MRGASVVVVGLVFGLMGCGTSSNDVPADEAGAGDAGGGPDGVALGDGASRDGASDGGSGGGDAAPDAPPSDDVPFAAKRAACTFKQGALAADTFGPSIANMNIPIDTVVIVSQENRPFDQYFSQLPAYGQPDVNVAPSTVTLKDANGNPFTRFHQNDYCFGDTAHDWDSMHKDWNNGANDGFVKVNDPNGARTLGYFDATDLTFYYALASTYGVGDAYFSALLGPTGPNRLYLYAGTSSGHIANGPGVAAGQPSIFRRLNDASVPFGVYSGATGTGPCPGPYSFETSIFCGDIPQGARSLTQFDADAAAGTLPAVSWIYPGSDEHPAVDMQVGEKDVQRVFKSLAASPQWKHALFIVTYDEAGGQYDHVAPPSACPPDPLLPKIPAEGSYAGKFDRYGFRVPFIMASPYSKPHFVSHVTNSHTSLLRFIELRWKLPATSDRDANESPLLEFFDFGAPAFVTPTVPPDVVIATPSTKGC